ncbi:hypothetical protein [Roseibium sp. RKSG952]|uniref:capsular polysaccharide export protein, LipB/KpsS family n=1 Tax=Roseibium sp. RKSG952 TaxID=2529384 RepID=UPI0012BCF8B2|nr:hypothetical protein [Roseibium sp. RKSG952]MTH98915.1 hypothetical protein [Roseibium sp. RKSG952]
MSDLPREPRGYYLADKSLLELTGQLRVVTGGCTRKRIASSADFVVCGLETAGLKSAVRAAGASKPILVVLPGAFGMRCSGYPTSMTSVFVSPDALRGGVTDPEAVVLEVLHAQTQPVEEGSNCPVAENLARGSETHGFPAWNAVASTSGTPPIVTALDPEPAVKGNQCRKSFWRRFLDIENDPERNLQRLERVLTEHTSWFDPYDGNEISAHEALEIAGLIESRWQQNGRPSHCYGAQYWNHPSINATFSGAGGPVTFHEKWEEALTAARRDGGQLICWAGRITAEIEEACRNQGVPVIRIEDGFLRSVGLGAGLARGAMLATDDLGIYYDPSRASRLQELLQVRDLLESEKQRGRDLIAEIVNAKVSKYNFGKMRDFRFRTDRKIILVPGQVADDAAIRKSRSSTIDCACTPNVNLDLLKLARDRNPEAFIVFKPHPDVETGLRKGKLAADDLAGLADEVATQANIVDLIEACDELETFSSLSGYEALLRGKKVTVHGVPFYAGWGLTQDLTPTPERTRTRHLDELVYLALVEYARTIDPVSLIHCSPEFLVSRLKFQRDDRRHLIVTAFRRHMSWLGRKLGL